MNRLARMLSLAVPVLLTLPNPVLAGDDGLYDAPPPPNSAFFRVLNGDTNVKQREITVAGKGLKVEARGLSSYIIVGAGEVDVAGSGGDAKLNLKSGAFYTLALPGGSAAPKLFNDTPLKDPAKGRLYFYNLSDVNDVDLFVPAAAKNALDNIAAEGSASVELKAPLQLDFVAKTDAGEIAHFAKVALKRRATITLMLFGAGGKYVGAAEPTPGNQVTSN